MRVSSVMARFAEVEKRQVLSKAGLLPVVFGAGTNTNEAHAPNLSEPAQQGKP